MRKLTIEKSDGRLLTYYWFTRRPPKGQKVGFSKGETKKREPNR